MYTYTCREAIAKSISEFMANFTVTIELWTDDSTFLAEVTVNIPKSSIHNGSDWRGLWVSALNTLLDTFDCSHPDVTWVAFDGEIVPVSRVTGLATVATSGLYADLTGAPSALPIWQSIVSQSGTSAPSNLTTPVNTYSGTPTMTWARTSAGVYTLTASSAVFSTTKTGIIVQPLQNLNASVKAVVTSTTVITITTAVQSVAVLGLLGLTAAPTDALLTGTMVYVTNLP